MHKYVDSPTAVQLHRDKGRSVAQIAVHFDVQQPAIYRAFRKEKYFIGNMLEVRKPAKTKGLLPPTGKYCVGRGTNADKAANAPEPVYRDPCFRCGIRSDIGCNCSKAKVGWRVG